MTDDERQELKDQILMAELASKRADTALKQRQTFWETPKTLAILTGTVLAAAAAIGGWTGYGIGQRLASPPQQVITLPPGTTITVPR